MGSRPRPLLMLVPGLLIPAVLASPASATQRVTGTGAPPDTARFQAVLESVRDSMEIRGLSAAVILPDGTLWHGQTGESSPDDPITPDMLFDAGSVGKMFTAAVILQLAEEGALGLDEPISSWLPDAPAAGVVTPRMLLTHTSGWADVWSEPSWIPRLVSAPGRRWTPAEVLEATPPPLDEPGGGWSYSSSGYAALGIIAESVGGRPLGELVRERILEPLRLGRTFHGAYEEPEGPVAHAWLDVDQDGEAEDFTVLLPATSWRTAAGPAGAILTNGADLATFTRALVAGRLHDAATVPGLANEWVERPDGNRHGLGVLEIEVAGTALVGHRGNAAGYSAAAWHAPEMGVTVVVLTNRHGILVTPVVEALLRAVDTERHRPHRGPARPPSPGHIP